MGVTLTHRQMGYAVALGVALILLARRGGEEVGSGATVTSDHPLVIEPPRLRVVSGGDTFAIVGPALFTYVGIAKDDESPTERIVLEAQALSAALAEAGPGLRALGVQVISVQEAPIPLDVPTDVDAAAGPRLAPGGVGVLFADPQRRLLRMDHVAGGAALVCAAARTFGNPVPPDYSAACR